MAADIITTLQTFTDTTQTQTLTPTQNAEPQAQPGLFASLVAECMDAEVLPEMLVVQPEEQALTFTGNNTFSQPVLELLAGTPEQTEEVLPQSEIVTDEEDVVTWPEEAETPEQPEAENFVDIKQAVKDIKDFARSRLAEIEIPADEIAEEVITDEVLAKIPDELRNEIGQVIHEVADAIKQEGVAEEQPVMKMLDALTDRFAVTDEAPVQDDKDEQEEQEDSLDVDETPEVPEEGAEFAGLAVAPTPTAPPTASADTPVSDRPDVLDAPARQVRQPRQTRPDRPEAQSTPEDSSEAPETQESRTNFREALENRNADNEQPEQHTPDDGQDQSQNQSQGQAFTDRRDNGTRESSTRSRRIEPRTQTERSTEQAPTRRTESRSEFASFFEGVLNNRRTASRTPAQPLDLRGTENFTQAGAIRDGLTNVVRFIRADGVQKARVVVDPPALGRVSVELTSGTSGVEASIKVSSEQIRQLVQDQLSQLRMNLSQQGVQVAEFTVDVQQDNSGQQQNPYQQQEQGMLNFGGLNDDDEAEEFRVDLEEGLLYWVA